MKFNPRINVLILNWNGEKVLNSCIESIKLSTYKNLSITIIDNGSTDKSLGKFFNEKNIKIIKIKKNLGFAKGYNYAFKQICNNNDDYYLILNNDATILPDTIDKLLNSLNKYGKNNIYSPKILNAKSKRLWFCGGELNILNGNPYHIGIDENESNIIYKTRKTFFVSACCMLISKKTINILNGFNEKYKMYFEDVDLCCRAKKNNIDCYFISDSIAFHNISYSLGGRFSFNKLFNKIISFLKFLFFNNNIFYFFYYLLLNMLLFPIYFLKLSIKKNIYE